MVVPTLTTTLCDCGAAPSLVLRLATASMQKAIARELQEGPVTWGDLRGKGSANRIHCADAALARKRFLDPSCRKYGSASLDRGRAGWKPCRAVITPGLFPGLEATRTHPQSQRAGSQARKVWQLWAHSLASRPTTRWLKPGFG